MATASDYLSRTTPINTGIDPSRGYSDVINVSFGTGKKSLDDQLKEQELLSKQLSYAQQSAVPITSAADQYAWAKAEAERAAQNFVLENQYKAAQESRAAQGESREAQGFVTSQKAAKQGLRFNRSGERRARKESKFNMAQETEKLNLSKASEARAAEMQAVDIATKKQAQDLATKEWNLNSQLKAQDLADARAKSAGTYGKTATSNKGFATPTMQYYTAPLGGTKAQIDLSRKSLNNPYMAPPAGATTTPRGPAGSYGSGYNAKTGTWWYI